MLKKYLPAILVILHTFIFTSEASECGNSEQAIELVNLIKNDKIQKRTNIRCNKLLALAAEEKAKKMAEFGLVAHNLGGSPNSHLTEIGYLLPEHYGTEFNSNQVEAIAGGYSDATDVWKAFKNSKTHRAHLLGEHEFYLEQDEIGIAFIKKWESPHVEYWVVYLAKSYQKKQPYNGKLNDIPNKNLHIIKNPKKTQQDNPAAYKNL